MRLLGGTGERYFYEFVFMMIVLKSSWQPLCCKLQQMRDRNEQISYFLELHGSGAMLFQSLVLLPLCIKWLGQCIIWAKANVLWGRHLCACHSHWSRPNNEPQTGAMNAHLKNGFVGSTWFIAFIAVARLLFRGELQNKWQSGKNTKRSGYQLVLPSARKVVQGDAIRATSNLAWG